MLTCRKAFPRTLAYLAGVVTMQIAAIAFDIGNTLVRYWVRADFPAILSEAIRNAYTTALILVLRFGSGGCSIHHDG